MEAEAVPTLSLYLWPLAQGLTQGRTQLSGWLISEYIEA